MRSLLLLLILVGLLVPSASAQVNPVTLPVGVHLSLGPDPYTTMVVSWSGLPTVVEPRVEYGLTAALGTIVPAVPIPLPGSHTWSYTALLTGLEPGTVYHYRVFHGLDSDPFTFRTLAPDLPYLRITAWGDQGVPDPLNPIGENDGFAPALTTETARRLAPDLHLHAGDLSYSNGVPRTWDQYFTMLEPFAARTPYMSAVGNHEREAGQSFAQYDGRLIMPTDGTNRWWTVKIGDTQIVSLDSEQACTPLVADDAIPGIVARNCAGGANQLQLAFLRATLQAARADPNVKWIIVFHHYLLWSDGSHGSNLALRGIWGPVYDEFSVDLVIQGHDHVYERTKTLVGDGVASAGTTYVTAGTGGASHYAFQSPPDARPEWEAAFDNEHYGALFLNITDEMIRGEFHGIDTVVYDRFAIIKDANGKPIQVGFPEVALPETVPLPPQMPGPDLVVILAGLALVAFVQFRRRSA
jgi:3',5'-cyclic AMP phosphodiesterase CpdA